MPVAPVAAPALAPLLVALIDAAVDLAWGDLADAAAAIRHDRTSVGCTQPSQMDLDPREKTRTTPEHHAPLLPLHPSSPRTPVPVLPSPNTAAASPRRRRISRRIAAGPGRLGTLRRLQSKGRAASSGLRASSGAMCPVCISYVRSSPVGAMTSQHKPCITHPKWHPSPLRRSLYTEARPLTPCRALRQW